MDNGLVSAIVPTYNKGPYLHESVGSILAQEYPNIEIIIVNDGSTDNSSDIARALIAENPHRSIRLIETGNRGISAARNAGIKEARGSLVMCLDGDDRAERTFVRKALQAMAHEGVNLVTCDTQLFGDESGEWIPERYDSYYIRYDNCIPTMAIFDRALWVTTGGYKEDIPFAEDWEFWINCSRHNLRVKQIREKLFFYRRLSSGLLSNYLKDQWKNPVALMMFANSDLYNVEDLKFALGGILEGGDPWYQKLLAHNDKYPSSWLLKLILGVFSESKGNFDGALQLYAAAAQLSQFKEWMPLYKIACIVDARGQHEQARDLYHQTRVLRPDMHFLVGNRLDELMGSPPRISHRVGTR